MCEVCGGDLPPRRGGPPRKYCTITCKEKARNARVQERVKQDKEFREQRARQRRESWERLHPPKPPRERKVVPPEKACRVCQEVKPVEEFHLTGAGYPRSDCKECDKAAHKKRYAENPEVRERAKKKSADWQKKNPERAAEIRRRNKHKYKVREYGIDFDRWTEMLIEQSGRCGICAEPMEKPCVDHCHDSHEVRGLLCRDCNLGLGHFKDSPERLEAAILYLKGIFTAAP